MVEDMIYVYYGNLNKDSLIGVKKKILSQCRTFRKLFGTAYYTIFAGQVLYLLQDEKVIEKEYAITRRMCNEIMMAWIEKYGVKRTYIRYPFSDIWLVDFLKELKKRKIRSVLEFPTLPYDGEDGIIRPIEDNYYRKQLYKYIECCTTYANYKSVFDIPCIPLVNGVDINEHKVKKKISKDKEDVVLIAVATMRREHGYERVIKGLHEYYTSGGKREIHLNLVGSGPQIQYYERLVREYALEKRVSFYGFLQGEALDKVYEESDIGLGALGIYKSGISAGVGIKAAEYCVRGLPMIMPDDYGFENKYYVLKVPNDNTAINIDNLIDFYDGLQDKDYIMDMHNYAVEKYSWDKVLEPVIKYLNENGKF